MEGRRVPRDTSASVTVTVCKTRSTEELHRSAVQLWAFDVPGCRLYLPKQQAQQATTSEHIGLPQLDELFAILYSLHLRFQTDGTQDPTVPMYHDPANGIIAFNSQDETWYNAAQYVMVQVVNVRAEFWYPVICHELAHHFVRDHNCEFSNYFGKIALEYAQKLRDAQELLSSVWPCLLNMGAWKTGWIATSVEAHIAAASMFQLLQTEPFTFA